MFPVKFVSVGLSIASALALGFACRSDQKPSASSQVASEFSTNSDLSVRSGEHCNQALIRLDPPSIGPDGSTILSWNLPGYQSVRNEQGLFFEERGPNGSIIIRGGPSRVLRLLAKPIGNGPESIFEIPLRVEAVGGEPRILSFYSTKAVVGVNEATQLRWIVSGCSSIEVRGPGGWTHGAPCRPFEDSIGVAIPETGTYVLTLKDAFNSPLGSQIYRLEVR